jgi:hypothetical protein
MKDIIITAVARTSRRRRSRTSSSSRPTSLTR